MAGSEVCIALKWQRGGRISDPLRQVKTTSSYTNPRLQRQPPPCDAADCRYFVFDRIVDLASWSTI
ncbi:hypothetical protein C9427_24840 [Mesorhizobium helmanticense]|uniref:Uncharacterized protein n=1 Tax=Mesorhizobium helmanticense TaxID=1776423 RepID=A0A2T4IQ41_9HYPH|nr:hypothetical protein C9427_24840 [Mesorhizobium helmanticense]